MGDRICTWYQSSKDQELGRSKKVEVRATVMAKSRNSESQHQELQLEIAAINDKFGKSESSQREMYDRLGTLENKMEVTTQQLAATNQQLEEVTRLLKLQLVNQQSGGAETSNSMHNPRAEDQEPRTRRETVPQTGGGARPRIVQEPLRNPIVLEEGLDEPRRGRDARFQDPNFQRINMPRMDFPTFSGEHPADWVEDCQFYFEAFQTPEMYKTRMATMNFTGDAREWYRSYKIDKPHPP